jgi:hypothetical protein
LIGWAPGPKAEGTGISLRVWNKNLIFETILRLKGNIVAPGTWIFPDDPQIKLARPGTFRIGLPRVKPHTHEGSEGLFKHRERRRLMNEPKNSVSSLTDQPGLADPEHRARA